MQCPSCCRAVITAEDLAVIKLISAKKQPLPDRVTGPALVITEQRIRQMVGFGANAQNFINRLDEREQPDEWIRLEHTQLFRDGRTAQHGWVGKPYQDPPGPFPQLEKKYEFFPDYTPLAKKVDPVVTSVIDKINQNDFIDVPAVFGGEQDLTVVPELQLRVNWGPLADIKLERYVSECGQENDIWMMALYLHVKDAAMTVCNADSHDKCACRRSVPLYPAVIVAFRRCTLNTVLERKQRVRALTTEEEEDDDDDESHALMPKWARRTQDDQDVSHVDKKIRKSTETP